MIIEIKNLKLQTIIGILPLERQKKQNIVIDSRIYYHHTHLSLKNGYLDYNDIITCMKKMIIENQYGLLEVAINDILWHFMSNFQAIYKISLSITKSDIFSYCDICVANTINRKNFTKNKLDSKIYRI